MILSFISSKIKCKVKTEATVSEVVVKSTFWRGKTLSEYTPVFTYTAQNREYIEKADFSVKNSEKFVVGQKLIIRINPNRPNEFRVVSNVGILIFGLVLAAAGAFLIVLNCR